MSRFVDWRGHRALCFLARTYLAAVFLLACWHKIMNPYAFALDVATYQILPLALVNPVAITLPWVELGAGLMLVLGFRTRAAVLVINGMLVVFIAALLLALQKGLDISCGCFASQSLEEDPISYGTVLRDLLWLAVGVYVLIFDRKPLGIDSLLGRGR